MQLIRLFYFTHCSLIFLLSVAWILLFPHCFTDGSVCSVPLIYAASRISFHVHQALAMQWIGFVLCTSETLNLERGPCTVVCGCSSVCFSDCVLSPGMALTYILYFTLQAEHIL